MVRTVTRKHAEAFVAAWYQTNIGEAFDATGIITWPVSVSALRMTPEQARFRDIEDEICDRVFDSMKDAIADAFLSIANEVLDRERKRNPKRRK